MRWQRPAFGALQRFADLTQGFQLRELIPAVVPTVSLGRDHTDQERATFHRGELVPSVGGVPAYLVTPIVGAVELLAAWMSRSGGPLNGGMAFITQQTLTHTTINTSASTIGVCNATLESAVFNPPSWERSFESPSDQTIFLPVRGTIVTPGVTFAFGGMTNGQTFSMGVLVRNVGGP